MPHIKVKPFDTSLVKKLHEHCSIVEFVAFPIADETRGYLIGIMLQSTRFLLLLRPIQEGYLLKYEKLTRPLNISLIKQAILEVAQALRLEIVFSNIQSHSNTDVFASKYEKPIRFFESDVVFGYQKICVEVGFGSGRHLLYQAKKHPDTLFIGIEIHTPSALQVLKQIAIQEITNVWVVNYDARLFLEMLPSNLLETIYVHFPVPWDKKPHRRVISASFVDQVDRVLKVGGTLELRTDSDRYFEYALGVFSSRETVCFEVCKNRSIEIISKYEARWRRMQKDIYDIVYRCETVSKPCKLQGEFSFDIVKYKKGMESRLPSGSKVFDGYFVHIEQLYRMYPMQGLLVRLSLGGFDRPEHLYVIIDDKGVLYYPNRPVRTSVNLLAHQKLVAILQGACGDGQK